MIIIPACKRENLLSMVKISPTINLGRISYNSYKSFYINVKNIGSEDVIIKKIKTSCGCMSAKNEYINYSIHPQESLNVEFKYKPLSSGYVEKDINFYFCNYRESIKIYVKGFATE